MKRHLLTRILTAVTLVLLACTALGEQPEKPPEGQGKYLIVLWHPGTPVPGKKEERMKNVPEPDVAKLGGRVLAAQANRRIVFLPYEVAKQLRKHQAVSYIQRIWTGEDFSEWNETDAAASRPERIAADSDQFTWAKDYTYDADGNITRIGSTASGYDEFVYDGVGRLTEAHVNGVPETYFYDAFGNLTGFGRQTGGRAIPVDPATNRLVGANYDAAGNITTRKEQGSYVYDPLNMIVAYETVSGDPRRILYDANDERIGMTDGSTLQRWTIRDLDGQILREFKGDQLGLGMVWWWEQDHIRGEGQLIAGETQTWKYNPEEESQFTYGGKRHYHLDHLGSVRIVTSQAGKAIAENDFFPFGAARTRQYQEQLNEGDPHTDGMRFAGHWRDFMGHLNVEDDHYLDYMHARYYDPHLGQFLSPDPVLGNLLQPQSWNRYAYVLNNPTNFVDPFGLAARRPGEQVQPGDTCDGKAVDGWCTGDTITVETDSDETRARKLGERMLMDLYLMALRADQELALRQRDAYKATAQGMMGFVDGVIPFGDPLQNTFELYGDGSVEGLEYSQMAGLPTQWVGTAVIGGQVIWIGQLGRTGRLFAQGTGYFNKAFGNSLRIGWGGAKGRPDAFFRIVVGGKRAPLPYLRT